MPRSRLRLNWKLRRNGGPTRSREVDLSSQERTDSPDDQQTNERCAQANNAQQVRRGFRRLRRHSLDGLGHRQKGDALDNEYQPDRGQKIDHEWPLNGFGLSSAGWPDWLAGRAS